MNQIINSNKLNKLTCKMFDEINLSWNSEMNYLSKTIFAYLYNSHNDSWCSPAPGKMVFHRYILFSSYIFSSPSKHATAGLPDPNLLNGQTAKQHFQKCLNPKKVKFKKEICENNFFLLHFFLLTLRMELQVHNLCKISIWHFVTPHLAPRHVTFHSFK